MRRLLIVMLLAAIPCHLPAQPADLPEIAGVLNGETVLDGSYRMAGDILVPAGSRLVIRAGTTIYVHVSESTKIDPEYFSPMTELLVRGELLIEGTRNEPVTFLPEMLPADNGAAWSGLILDRAEAAHISFVRIVRADTALQMYDTDAEVSDSSFLNSRYGIIAQGGGPKIIGNRIERGEGGVFCWDGTRAYLKYNIVADNDEEGIVVDRNSRPYIDRNSVNGNDIGLVLPRRTPYDPNGISGNRVDVMRLESQGAP